MDREASPSRPPGLRRRTILAGATAALPAWSHAAPQLSAAQRGRLGVTTVCFRGRYAVNFPGAPKTTGESLLGAPRFIRDNLGLSNIELWSLQFEADSPDYCDRLRAAAEAAGGRIINIQLDGPYDFSSCDADQRARSLTYVKGWMDRASRLGAASLRANFSGLQPQGPFPLQQVAEAFRRLAA